MGLFESTYRWIPWKSRPDLRAIPFEELQNRYSEDPKAVYEEFIRRLRWLVFYAVEEYMDRTQPRRTREEIEDTVIGIFQDFSPEFNSGEPQMILVRFANIVRRALDDEAFRVIARRFYRQVPIYHLSEPLERRLLAAAYEEGLSKEGTSMAETLAERFDVAPDEVRKILAQANKNLAKVIQQDFDGDELRELSEGYLP
jgi:hypothetical protein